MGQTLATFMVHGLSARYNKQHQTYRGKAARKMKPAQLENEKTVDAEMQARGYPSQPGGLSVDGWADFCNQMDMISFLCVGNYLLNPCTHN